MSRWGIKLGVLIVLVAIFYGYFDSPIMSSNNIEVKQGQKRVKKKVVINTDRRVESEIVKDYFKRHADDYEVMHRYYCKKTPEDYYFQWAHFYWDVDYEQFTRSKSQKLVSHLPNANIFDDKNELVRILDALDRSGKYGSIRSSDFLPKTYMFDVHSEKYSEDEKELFQKLQNQDELGQKWIAKNPNGCCGKGIKLVFDLRSFLEEIRQLKSKKQGDKSHFRYKQIQKYIENPLLINQKKAEYRAYILVACSDPLLIIYNKGFIKSALRKYDLNSSQKEIHLTNLAEARLHEEEYEREKNSAYLNVGQFEQFLKSQYSWTKQDIEVKLYKRMKQILTYTFLSGKSSLKGKYGQFETFAVDILFDSDMNQYLLEINQPYAVEGAELPGYKDVLPDFYHSTLDLVLQIDQNSNQLKNFLANHSNLKLGRNMDILYNEASGYSFID